MNPPIGFTAPLNNRLHANRSGPFQFRCLTHILRFLFYALRSVSRSVTHQPFSCAATDPLDQRGSAPIRQRFDRRLSMPRLRWPNSARPARQSCQMPSEGTLVHLCRLGSLRWVSGRGFPIRGLGFCCSLFLRVSCVTNHTRRRRIAWHVVVVRPAAPEFVIRTTRFSPRIVRVSPVGHYAFEGSTVRAPVDQDCSHAFRCRSDFLAVGVRTSR